MSADDENNLLSRIRDDFVVPQAVCKKWVGWALYLIGTTWFNFSTLIFGGAKGPGCFFSLVFVTVLLVAVHSFLVSLGFFTIRSSPGADPGLVLLAVCYGTASLVSIPCSAVLATLGRRLTINHTPEKVVAGEQLVVYLRSFADDTSVLTEAWAQCCSIRIDRYDDDIWGNDPKFDGVTAEQWLASMFGRYGSFVAIGRPGERFTPVGAGRIYVGDNWQNVVKELIRDAKLVIIRLGDSPGLWWEIETVLKTVPLDRVLFQLPDAGWFGSRKRRIYRDFRERASPLLQGALPTWSFALRFIALTASGVPVPLRPNWWRVLLPMFVSPEKAFESLLRPVTSRLTPRIP